MEIWRRAVDETHDFLTPEDRRAIEAEVSAFLPEAPLDIAVDDSDRPVGFMLLDGCHMEALFIDPDFHGLGVGRKLVEEAVRRCPILSTDVNEQNVEAMGFYEWLGFERCGHSAFDGQGRPYPLIHLRYREAALIGSSPSATSIPAPRLSALAYSVIRPLLFRLEPERAHAFALTAARLAGNLPGRALDGAQVILMGLRFPNRLGLAAGFDKNGVSVDGIGKLGFGFIEVGTVTPRPQPGQPRPRLFRLPGAGALINRLGFPNLGAATVARRLAHRRYRGILGVNIGKNADTPLDAAVDDYIACLRAVYGVADYVAVNVSSPNTVALRELHRPERLEPLLGALLSERDAISRESGRRIPIVLKVSPDLEFDALEDITRIALRVSLDGIIATNTTTRRDATIVEGAGSEVGGLSGAPLHRFSLRTVSTLRRLLGPGFPIIGVGGVDSPARACAMRSAGADLVQIYTGLVYRGPTLVAQCVRVLDGAVHRG